MPRKPPPSNPLAKPVSYLPIGTLRQLRTQARDCRACPLWKPATQTVFGLGPVHARVVFIGEQPGAQEDLQGVPFVGPAGRLLREALQAAGIDSDEIYLTNTVKHFKFEQRGKTRLHKRANAAEQAACRPWLAAELLQVRPRFIVALGAMAAQTLFGNAFRLSVERGQWRPAGGAQALATWHPSAILRMTGHAREQARGQFQADLATLAAAIRSSGTTRTTSPSH